MNEMPSNSALSGGILALAEAFGKIYISIAEVNLSTGYAHVLKSSDTAIVGKEIPWNDLLIRYINRRACADDQDLIQNELSLDRLCNFVETDQTEKELELRCQTDSASFEWVEISVSLISPAEKKLLVTTRNINEQRILKSIVNRFVYNNCDYFVLLDAKNNSFKRYSGKNNGTPLPPACGDNYTAEMVRHNQNYLVAEDVEWVTDMMQISHILKTLENQEEFSFSCGAASKQEGYRRKRMQFLYHDKSNQMILMTRTDITQIYMEEKSKNQQLLAALMEAQSDSLTGLYNQKATSDLVSRSLLDAHNTAALLFVDVDNFKMVNDVLGHLKGNDLLQHMARSLKSIAGEFSIVGRVGGDEFLFFLPVVSTRTDIEQYAKQICRIFVSFTDCDIKKLAVSCSIGISVFPDDGTDYNTLVRKADQALYDSKRHGKNRYSFYSDEIEKVSHPTMFSLID